MTSGRRGEQVLLPPPPLGSSARLSCPRRGGSPTSRLPAAQQPAASLHLSPGARLSVLAASFGVGASCSARKVSVLDGGMDPGFDR